MLNTARLTDERLKSWLDSNQLDRERLCQAVLSVDGRFKNVRLRQPRGGADGGRDLEARFDGGRLAYVAVGFRNSVNDSAADRQWAKRKFLSDLDAALDAEVKPRVFAFMTNTSLTVKQKRLLQEAANSRGITACEIFDREHLRVVLDSPDGLSFRFQYLGISLSEPEQAAFFGRWGSRLEEAVRDVGGRLDQRIDRLEFMLEKNRRLRHFGLILELQNGGHIRPGDHFRVVMSVFLMGEKRAYNELVLAACNETQCRSSGFAPKGDGWLSVFQARRDLKTAERQVVTSSSGLWESPMSRVVLSGGFSEWIPDPDAPRLADLDEALVMVYVNKKLADRIDRVVVHANEYVLWDDGRSDHRFCGQERKLSAPWPFDEQELKDPWVRLERSRDASAFRFSEITPQRSFRSQPVVSEYLASR